MIDKTNQRKTEKAYRKVRLFVYEVFNKYYAVLPF